MASQILNNEPRLDASEQNLKLQAEKIGALLDECERLGADLFESKENFKELCAMLGTDEEHAAAALGELIRWRALGQSKLGLTLETAEHQADILWDHVRAMGSPGHRAVCFFGRTFGQSWLGRKIKRLISFLLALKQA